MFAAVLATSLLALSARVAAQTASTVDLQAERAHFTQSRLVPELLASFNPSAVLTASFNGTAAQIGRPLTVAQVAPMPEISVIGGANFSSQGYFTVAMVDPGVVGSSQSGGQTRHWLVNNVTLTGAGPFGLEFDNEAITTYGGPFPASGSGPHRYTILLLPQPDNFVAPAGLNTPGVAISTFDFAGYVSGSGLQAPVAGFYFTVEQGTSSASIPATTAVVSSTLAPAASSGSVAAASGSASRASGSVSASRAASSVSSRASASASATGAAGKRATVGAGALLGAVGLVAVLL